MHTATRHTTIGFITALEDSGTITRLYLPNESPKQHEFGNLVPVLDKLFQELNLYFAGELKDFSVSFTPQGTNFQKLVWTNLLQVPYGETRTYGSIAQIIESPKSSRAIGAACNRNPIPILIPCHRIIGAKSELTGYRGGLDIKKKLLQLEQCKNVNQAYLLD